MEGIVNSKLVTYKRNRFVHRWWYRVVIWLAAGAVFITTYFLMLPALTATENEDPGTTQIVSGNIINDEIQVNNVFPVQAILGIDARYGGKDSSETEKFFKEKDEGGYGYDVILIHTGQHYFALGEFFYGKDWRDKAPIDVESFPPNFSGFKIDLADWIGIRIECATKDTKNSTLSYDYHYVSQISMKDSKRRAEEENGRPNRIMNLANTDTKGFILMIRKTYMDEGFNGGDMYWPACSIGSATATYEETKDDKVHINQTPLSKLTRKNVGDKNWKWHTIYSDTSYLDLNHEKVIGNGVDALAYITFSPYVDQSNNDNAAENINNTEDKPVVNNFTFKLFDYTKDINMCESAELTNSASLSKLRAIAPYFNFRGGTYSDGGQGPWENYWIKYAACTCKRGIACKSVLHRKDTWDADGFTRYHATVEYDMRNYEDTTLQGYPMLSFTHDAEGNLRTGGPSLSPLSRSLKYLFNGQQAQNFVSAQDNNKLVSGAVTEYAAKNTILQYNEDTGEYWYDSAQNAVDYDKEANLFRVRSYRDRNELTAAFGLETDDYYDFMPFNYTKGIVSQVFYHDKDEYKHKLNEVSIPFEDPHFADSTPNITAPHIDSSTPTNANYWFGMTMEFSFIQGQDGKLVHVDSNGNKKPAQDMVFTFSGDDDVWVFIDDVLVLDLGGTHGSVTGSINFSTGEVKQYLDWNNGTESNTETSFPTTLRKCFDRAKAAGRVEWDSDGERFADYTTHTLKFYYLERGQAVANCSIRFNLQSFSDKSLVVEKQLDKKTSGDPHANEVLDYLQKTQEYKFRVLKDDKKALLFKEGDKFTKFNTITGETTKDCTVGESGIFTLKHGEQAIFEDMWEKTGSSDSKIEKYYVQELRPDGQKGHYSDKVQYTLGTASGVVITGEDTGTGFQGYMSSEMSPVETQTVTFKNTVKVDTLYDLKINKTIDLIDPARIEEYSSKEFSVEVKLDGVPLPVDTTYLVGTEGRTVQTEGIIKIKAGETVTIKGIVAGTEYTVKEVFDNGPAGFVAKYPNETSADGVSGEIDADNNNVTITINNVQCGAEIPLTISKQLVNATDNSNFTFKFRVDQIYKVNGNYIVDNSKEIDIINITISSKENDGIVKQGVSLKYLAEDFDEIGDTYFYYRIIEATDNGDKVSIIEYDSTAYVVTVKVSKDAAGNLTAVIESIEKFMDGNITDEPTQGNYEIEIINGLNGSVEFVNTLNLYSLPATGGSGEKFTASQFALGYVLLVGAVVFLMCCFTDKGRRDDSKKDKP